MTAEELAKSPVIRMAGSDGHIYETTADRAHEMADAARQEGVALKPFLKTKDTEGNVHEISPFDGEGLKTAQDRGDVQNFDEVNEDYFSAEALKAGATRFAIGLVNPLDWIKGVGTAAGTVAKGFVKGTVGTVLGAARGATYLGESITNAFTGDDDHTVSDAIGGVNSGMNKWLDILFEDVYASTGEYDGVEGAKKATGAVRNVAELVANVKGIGAITKGLAASEVAAAKAAGVVDTAKAAAAGMKVAHTATGALFGLGKYADVASDPNGPGGARQQVAALVAGSADAVFFGLWNPLKVSQKYAQEMSPFMDATRKEIMKRVMVKVGQAAESGATMALVEGVKQGAEQVASIGTEKVEGVDEEGNPVKNWAARTLKESALEVGTQFLVGSAFVALDVAEQEMGRFGYNRARKAQGEIPEGLSDKMKVAMSYQVERNRRAYAPERDRQARFALQAKLQPELGSANEAYKYSPDVKAVNEDGSVTFKDGSVWRLDPRMEGGVTITVSDGTILSESGELLGYRARQESGAQVRADERGKTDADAQVRADERGKTDADAQVRAASNSLVLLQQIDEGALPIKEVELAAVEPIAPTENGGIIEVWDPQKYKPIVVLEDLEGNLHALTGGKRILAAKGEGLEKLRAVIVREADGWTAEEASKLSATENLRQGLGTMKNVVEAVDSLGEEDVLQLAGWHQANGSREFASTLRRGLKFARNATPELKAALEDGRISDEFAANAAGALSMERLGENWQAAQKAVTDLVGNVGKEELEAVLWGVQKKLSGKAATPEEIADAVQECREEFNRKHGGADSSLDSDTTLVETGKNELKTIGEVEAGMEGAGEGSHAETQSRGEETNKPAPKIISIAKEGMRRSDAKSRINEQRANVDNEDGFTNSRTGISAKLSVTGVNKILSNAAVAKTVANGFTAAQHNEIAAHIKELFEDASLVEERPDRSGDVNIKSIKRFATPIAVDGKDAVALITVKESVEHGHRIYSLEGINIAALSPSMRRVLADRNSADNAASSRTELSSSTGNSLAKPVAGVNPEATPIYAAAEGAGANKAVDFRPDGKGGFTTLAFPEFRMRIDGEKKCVVISGVEIEDFEGGKIETAAALVAKVQAFCEEHGLDIGIAGSDDVLQVWDTVRGRIKAEGREAYSAKRFSERGKLLDQLAKSGLAAGVETDKAAFDAVMQKPGVKKFVNSKYENYGCVDPETGKIYLNPYVVDFNTPIHEYGHLAVEMTWRLNPELVRRGLALAKLEPAFDRKLKDPVYGRQGKDVAAEEVLVELIARKGEDAFRGDRTLGEKFKAWLVEFWRAFKGATGIKDLSEEQVSKMTVGEIADAMAREMMSGRKYGEGFGEVVFEHGGARVKTKPMRVAKKLSGRQKAVNEFVKRMGGAEDPANTETDMLALWVDNGGRLFDKLPFEIETGYSKGKSGVKKIRSSVADEFAESTAFYQDLDPAQRKVFFGTDKLEYGAIGEGLKNKLAEAGITRFTREDGTVDYEAAIAEFQRQWTNYERGERFLKERDEWQEERDRAYVEEMERAEAAEREAERAAMDEISAEEAAAREEAAKSGLLFLRGKKTDNKNEVKLSKLSEDGKDQRYYEVPFDKAVDKIVKNRKPVSDEHVFVSETPESLKDIGLPSLPVMINQQHIVSCYFDKGDGVKADDLHGLRDKLKSLPSALKKPLMVIASERNPSSSVVSIVRMTDKHGDSVIVPIEINGIGRLDGGFVDANIIKTAFGKRNAWTEKLAKAIRDEVDGKVSVFYLDKTQARQISNRLAREAFNFGKSEVQFLSVARTSNVIHSIADFGSPVKGVGAQKDSQQFKRWFGDSKKNPAGASKIVDENGEPLVVYRGADYDPLAQEAGKGVIKPEAYFTADPNYAKRYAGSEGAVRAYYLNIRHPFDIRDPECQKDFEKIYPGQKLARGKSGALDWAEAATIDGEFLEENFPGKYDGIIFDEASDWVPDGNTPKWRGLSYVPLHGGAQVKSATDNIGTFDPGNPDVRFARGPRPEAKYVKLTRVADDAGAGEQTPGALAASRELSRTAPTPLTTRGTRYVSLPLSEMNALARWLTGHAMPAEMSTGRKLGVPGKASTKHRKLVIAADVVGSIDKTDAAKETATLKQHGFFRNEDPNWVANHSPVEVRQERERSEEALSTRLEALADRRAKGTEPGGMAAGRKVFADQLAKVVMSMPHGQPGVLGAMQTVGGALERRVQGNDAEADAFLDWMEGRGTGNGQQGTARSPQERKAGMFGAFLMMPKEMEQRARGWYDAIRSTIAGDQKLADAFRMMTVRSMTEQGYSHLEQEILRAQSAQTEQALKKLREESNAPIAAGGLKDRVAETVVLSCHDRMGAALVRVDASVKLYLAAQKKLMASAPDAATKAAIKQQTDLFMGAIAQAKNQAELSRTAWERGHNNADARYLYRMVDILNEATVRDGLKMEDVSLYLDQQRVIETKGLSGSRGESTRQAQLVLDAMKRRLGAADYAKVEAFARKFAAIHEQELLNDPVLERILGKGTVDYWRGNTHYVTTKRQFSPEEMAEIEAARAAVRAANGGKGDDVVGEMFKFAGRAGMDTGAAKATARLKGSFSDKQEVMSATFEKVAAIKRWLRRCEYVIELRDLLKLAKVEGVHDFAAGEAKFPNNSRYGSISYMENGRKRVLVVPKEIADGFKAQREFDTPALKLCAKVNNIAREWWIDKNLVYWQRNIARNIGSIEMNMPGMKESAIKRGLRFVFPGLAPTTEIALTHLVRHMPEKMSLPLRKIWGEHTALFYAPKAKRMAMWLTDHNEMQKQLWAAQDRGDLGTVQEMLQDQRDMLDALRGNMLVGMARGEAGGTTAFLDDSVRTVGKTMARELQEMQAKPKWRRALEAANIFSKNAKQQVFEDVMAKFAAYLHDRAQFGTGNNRTVAESGLAVKKNVSIGEGERKGKDTRLVQGIFQPFWNMVEKGIVRNVKAYGERPGETFQKAAWRIAPMILHGLVGSGAIAAWILKANDGDEEKVLSGPMSDVYRYARDAQRAYQNCSNYVRENYHVTPLMTDGYTSIVLGMPLTDEERLLKPIARFVTDAASVAAGTKESLDVAKALHDATLGVVAPDFKLAGALPTLFDDTIHALWDNPNDYYTGGQKYDNDIWLNRNESWEMRGKFAMAMAKRLWNDFGGRNVLPVDRAGVDNGLGRAPGWVAKMVNDIPLASPILRSFVKVQVGSPKRDAAEITEVDNRRRAACRVHAKELFEIARREKRDLSLDRDRYTGMLKKWQQSSESLSDEDLAYIEQHYLNAWRAYEGAQYRADGEREKFRAKADKLGLEAAHLSLDFD